MVVGSRRVGTLWEKDSRSSVCEREKEREGEREKNRERQRSRRKEKGRGSA